MWLLFAFGSALFAGLTAIFAKCGVKQTDSTVATAIRTIVVLLFSWLIVFLAGSIHAVSYTHLDVYKRQPYNNANGNWNNCFGPAHGTSSYYWIDPSRCV